MLKWSHENVCEAISSDTTTGHKNYLINNQLKSLDNVYGNTINEEGLIQ